MCEHCPPISAIPPTDALACSLASDLISRSQELLPAGTPAEDQSRKMLILSHTFTRNALITHSGGVRQSELVRAAAHIAATEIRSQAEFLLRKAGLPPHFLLQAMRGVTDQFSEHTARSLAGMARPIEGFLMTPPGPRKEVS